MDNISFYKDENLHAIANYKAIPFNEKHEDNGFIIRVIELFKFTQIKNQLIQLQKLTGLTLDNIEPSIDEVIALIERGDAISKRNEEIVTELSKNYDLAKNIKEKAEEGGLKKPDSAPSVKAWKESLSARVSQHESNLLIAKEQLNDFNGIFGLLRIIIQSLPQENIKNINKKQMNIIPDEIYKGNKFRINVYYGKPMKYKDAYQYIESSFEKLNENILRILNSCTPSNDRYKLRMWENQRGVELYQYYYSQTDWIIKTILSADDYVNYILTQEKEVHDKKYLMTKSFI
ncbi:MULTISPECIES: hypothetical protein [Proteus]|uniref:hypothetical protein n=1 Tax=Proteus TaxID=583 RepID=UPI0018E4210F|nr:MULTISPECIES: hypothetical protein [Proteus]MBI6404937.1 hypothetical protein [Proteus sp. PR00208]